jgi:catechol 2,3-dioxygenase-like lactoylglutathione lyase family enzyme
MINHVALHVNDIDASKDFYAKALAPLGYVLTLDLTEHKVAGLGADGKTDLALFGDGTKQAGHIAFTASNKKVVDGVYSAALAAGGKDNGAPGYRKDHEPGYYAAFVRDPSGHNIEVVFMDPAVK